VTFVPSTTMPLNDATPFEQAVCSGAKITSQNERMRLGARGPPRDLRQRV
jgi:hypothetical protein